MITVYSSPTCAFCHLAMDYLKSKKQQFKEVDVTENREAAMWVIHNTGQLATPVLDINGTVILGFDRPKIDAALA